MNDDADGAPILAVASGPTLGVGLRSDAPPAFGVGASLALHAVFLALAVSVALSPRAPPAERPVSVEILTPEQFDAMTAPGGRAPTPTLTPTPAAPPAGPAMIRPTAMLSAQALANPRSRQARALLATLDETERMIQLCGLEAMEQVQAWRAELQPTQVVAYAMAEVTVSGDVVDAGGAAFRSGNGWYNLKFRCRLAPDHRAVAAFEFLIGSAVPVKEWEARNLPTDTGIGLE